MQEKISLKDVSKAYDTRSTEVLALDRINLSVADGEFVALVGPSGCGKSTLLYIVGGFLDAEGEVLVNGAPIDGPGVDRGVVFQEYALFPWMTVRKNIAYGPRQRGMTDADCNNLAARLIKLIGLDGFADRYPRELSGGMKQRVAIARMLAGDPEVFLLDEPLGALDAQTREIMQDELLRIWLNNKKTVIMVTHDVVEAVFLASRICVMSARPGRIVKEFRVQLDRGRSREEIMLSDEFNRIRNDVWLAVREQALLMPKQ